MSEPIRHTMPYEHPDAMEVAMGDAYIAAIARKAPHECKDRDCPGDINRRKLELWDELVAFVERCELYDEDAMIPRDATALLDRMKAAI